MREGINIRISKRKINEAKFRAYLLELIEEYFKDKNLMIKDNYYEYKNGMFVLIDDSIQK